MRQTTGENMAGDMAHALARLETSVDVVDLTVLELTTSRRTWKINQSRRGRPCDNRKNGLWPS